MVSTKIKKRNFEFRKLFTPQLIILYLLIIVGVYLRLQGVFTNSFAYTYDVGRDLLAIADIVSGQKLSLIGPTTGLPGVFYGPWWYLMLSPFFVIFSGNPAGIAFTMALVGIILIPLSYFLGRKISNEFLALTMAAFVSVSPELISLSSQIWNPNIAPLLVLIVLLLLVKIFSKEDKPWAYFLLGILLLLTLDVEIIFGLFFSTGVVISILLIKRLKIKPVSYLAFIVGALIILSPRILFELKHSFLMSQSFVKYFANGAEGDRVSGGFLSTLLNRMDVFLNEYSYTIAFSNKVAGGIVLLIVIGVIVVLFKKLSSIEKNLLVTSLITFVVFFLGTIFFAHDIWPHYLVGLPIIYILVTAIALGALRFKLNKNYIASSIVIVLFLINLNPVALVNNLNKPIWEGDASVYRNQLAVVDYVYQDAGDKKFKYVVYTPPVHDYTYQYLFDWKGRSMSNTPQAQADVAYFILEPDTQDPTRLTRWLDDRKNDGRIESAKKMSGGIIVQKRIIENEK